MNENQNNASRRLSRRLFISTSSAVLAGLMLAGVGVSPVGTPAKWRFGIVTDCHYADREPVDTRYYRDSIPKLQDCVQKMNDLKVDFLAEIGDFKDQDATPSEEKTLEYLRSIEEAFSHFQGPRYHVLGNHDMDSLSKSQFLSAVKNTNIPVDRSYYSFDLQGLHFVVLDGNYLSDGQDFDHGNFDWKDTNIPPAQLDWLQQDLASAPAKCVVFIHQCLDGTGDIFVKNSVAVRTILEQSGKVLLVLQGHNHAGGYKKINGIPYYTLRSTVDGAGLENKSYALVEIDAAGVITITGFGQAASHG